MNTNSYTVTSMNKNKVQCQICKKWFKQITGKHLQLKHDITFEKYKEMFPNAETHPQWLRDQLIDANIEKWADPKYKARTAKAISDKNKIVMNKPEIIETLKIGSDRRWAREPTEEYLQTMKEMGERQIGENNPNWRGGTSFKDYPKEFFNQRNYIREKYNNCDFFTGIHKDICNKDIYNKNEELSIHHIDYNKLNNNEDNLIPICRRNHSLTNTNRSFWYRLIKYTQNYDNEYYKNIDTNFNIFKNIKELI